MTAIITSTSEVIETRIVDQATGNTIRTSYHNTLQDAADFADQFNPDRIEFEEMDC